MNYPSFIATIATLFLLIICGFVLRKLGIMQEVDSKRFSTLVLKVAQPCMIIAALAGKEFTYENLKSGLIVFGLGLVIHGFMAVIAYFLCKGFKDLDERKITEFSLIFTNTGFIGFPIMESLFPENGLFLAAFYVISFHFIIWSWGLAILGRGRDDIKLNVRKILFNFGSVPCMIGVAIFLIAWPFADFKTPDFIMTFMNYLGNMCTPLSALITGSALATRTAKQIFGQPKMYLTAALKLFVMPLAVCVLAKLLCELIGVDPLMFGLFLTVEAALPSAATVTMFCELHDINPGYASQTVGTSALFSVASMPLIVLVAEWILRL